MATAPIELPEAVPGETVSSLVLAAKLQMSHSALLTSIRKQARWHPEHCWYWFRPSTVHRAKINGARMAGPMFDVTPEGLAVLLSYETALPYYVRDRIGLNLQGRFSFLVAAFMRQRGAEWGAMCERKPRDAPRGWPWTPAPSEVGPRKPKSRKRLAIR